MKLAADQLGLSSKQVAQRKVAGLDNRQGFENSRTLVTILRVNIFTLFNGVVGSAFLLLLFLGQWKDALFGLAVLSNITIGVIQEYRSKRILDKLAILNQSPVTVRREGTARDIPIQEVVQDDLIELGTGDQVPADAELLAVRGIEVDESLLSGESEPVSKIVGDRILAGSGILAGIGLARVTEVGRNTYSSQLLGQARVFSLVASELRQSLNKLILWISWALAPITAIVLYGQFQATDDRVDALVRATASIISIVPQGLVLITSIAFGIAAIKLANQRVLLQELAAVEGLARVDVICFDKTGTLTDGTIEFDSAEELSGLRGLTGNDLPSWQQVLAQFANEPNPNVTALAIQKQFPLADLEVTDRSEFNSDRKFGALEIAGTRWLLGAPEVLTDDALLLSRVSDLANLGRRTLLLAADAPDRLPLVLLSFMEKVRPEAFQTLEYFRSQGVGVRILSGDHPQTVANAAKAAGLILKGPGFDARTLSEADPNLSEILEEELVFGRVTPDQKKTIVIALQQKGHVVAMVGDGVNDALALKQSDLGIAMGAGSALTKAAANLVLLDNRFETLPKIVGEGRRVIANVERLSSLFLTKTVWAIVLAVVFSLLLWEYPMLPRQLSAIDGFTIGIPAFLLALLPNQQLYRPGFLKRALFFCVPAGLITATAIIALGSIARDGGHWSGEEMQTATAILLSVTGLWVLATLVRPLNGVKLWILVSMALAGVLAFVIPFTAEFFEFVHLSGEKIALTGLVAIIASAGIEISRYLVNRFSR